MSVKIKKNKYNLPVHTDKNLDIQMSRNLGWGGRWEGGSGWGIHVNPRLIHVNVWQKPLQYCKVISLPPKKKSRNLMLRFQKLTLCSLIVALFQPYFSGYLL